MAEKAGGQLKGAHHPLSGAVWHHPMFLCTQTILSSVKQTQIDERMVEVQNQCQILSSKIARTVFKR